MLTLGTQSFQLFKGEGNPVGLTPKERRHHLWIMGKTGQGKSTLLLNLLAQDLQSDVGVILIDPHGDLAERVLDFIPRHRINETIYLDAADLDYPIGLNPLDRHQDQHLVISGIISIFKKLWSDSWGPRLEHILRHSLMALWETPGATMMELLKLLVDYRYQTQMVQRLRDPVVKSFFEDEFFRWPREFRAQAIAPIQNKAGQLLASPVLRNILGQRRSKINFRKVLDGQILIVNLSKGRIGED
ncbi:MAG: helicase HerA domain-containing protein, partial [Candidatus Binatia bacterium]